MPTHKIDGHTIHTSYDHPPIPIRSMDWSAVLDDYDGAPDAGPQLVGTGATLQEAVDDLLQQIADADAAYQADEAADHKREEGRDRAAEQELDDGPYNDYSEGRW